MKKYIETIIILLRKIIEALQNEKESSSVGRPPLTERKFYSKQDVLKLLNMTDVTYKRNLKKGILNPMRLIGTDVYFEEDLLKALEESRMKGKI
ncbi:hypothetical protein [Sphingobacterium bambusae]|uniref:DNA-binding protein n=1 Tax=Sphingobacterium bambusae TaxID=662858 RepID=A0ABW6BFW0_9SPHI|nr:hypothetical protein [Sphingobacterium bambusae]WPL46890.1 hypothetical protein SCB77_13055 [Sphingobacterium bambusae]